tara:strand:- start:118581 stop:119501 length:921 start_codon:yes stop_codon:yes gene_type:complete
MNWYRILTARVKKIASVTFFVNDSHKIAQPKDLLGLSSELANFFYYNSKSNEPKRAAPTMNDIVPDTSHSDFDGHTGTINVYPNPRKIGPQNMDWQKVYELSPEELRASGGEYYENSLTDMMPVIDEWIQNKQDEGYAISKRMDKSNMTDGPVLRLDIKDNPSAEYPEIPEVNLSNINAYAMFRMLGLPQEPSGSVNAQALKTRIEQVSREEMEKEIQPSGWVTPPEDTGDQNAEDDAYESVFGGDHTRDPWETPEPIPVQPNQPEGQMGMYMQGRDEAYIDRRLQDLYRIADFAVEHGFQEIAWA